jgi:hypothetical protein
LHILAQMQTCQLLTGSWVSAPITPPLYRQYTLFRKSLKLSLMCCLLASIIAYLLVPCTSREPSRDMVHNNCFDSRDSRTETRCHLLHDFTPLIRFVSGGVGLVLGLCWSSSWRAGCCPPCEIPRGLCWIPWDLHSVYTQFGCVLLVACCPMVRSVSESEKCVGNGWTWKLVLLWTLGFLLLDNFLGLC